VASDESSVGSADPTYEVRELAAAFDYDAERLGDQVQRHAVAAWLDDLMDIHVV